MTQMQGSVEFTGIEEPSGHNRLTSEHIDSWSCCNSVCFLMRVLILFNYRTVNSSGKNLTFTAKSIDSNYYIDTMSYVYEYFPLEGLHNSI